MTRRTGLLLLTPLTALCVCCALLTGDRRQPPVDAAPRTSMTIDGRTYHVFADGHAYERQGDGWQHVARVYDPDWRDRLVEADGALFKLGPDGKRYRLAQRFACDFDAHADLHALIGVGEGKAGFTAFTLQSSRAPRVADYVALRKRILQQGADFSDNRVEPSAERVAAGRALRCVAEPPTRGMVCSKASLSTELIAFRQGETVRYRARYWLEPADCGFTTLVDLEATAFEQHAGIRLALRGGRYLACELKFADKPMYTQPREGHREFPRGRWVQVTWELTLATAREGADAGRVRVWQDDALVIDARGQTLPLPDTIYDSLEIGLSAIAGPERAVLHVDDVEISRP